MRTIKNLVVPQNDDAKFPFSTIQNETATDEGTPIIEEIFGDVLTNNYKLLQEVGIAPTGTQDSDETQYQILEALKKLPNVLNDVEQILILNGSVWGVPFNLDYLPNKYIFIGRASEDYVKGATYTFKGSSDTAYGFISTGFKSGDDLLVVIDTSFVRAYSLTANTAITEVFAVMGTPVAFNDTNKMWYQDGGQLLSDVPSVNNLESVIRVNMSDSTIILNDMFVIGGHVLCFCLNPSTNNYFFRHFSLTNLTASTAVTLSGAAFSNASDFMPYAYAAAGVIYISNGMNTNTDDFDFTKLNYNGTAGTLTFVSSSDVHSSFVNTTNAVIKAGLLYTMVSGVLKSFNLTSGAVVALGSYSGVAGQIIGFNGFVYFNSGEVCRKWF